MLRMADIYTPLFDDMVHFPKANCRELACLRIFQHSQRIFKLFGLPIALLRRVANPSGRLIRSSFACVLGHAAIGRGVVSVVPDAMLQTEDQSFAGRQRRPSHMFVLMMVRMLFFTVMMLMLMMIGD
jgi:hypothetical protein